MQNIKNSPLTSCSVQLYPQYSQLRSFLLLDWLSGVVESVSMDRLRNSGSWSSWFIGGRCARLIHTWSLLPSSSTHYRNAYQQLVENIDRNCIFQSLKISRQHTDKKSQIFFMKLSKAIRWFESKKPEINEILTTSSWIFMTC